MFLEHEHLYRDENEEAAMIAEIDEYENRQFDVVCKICGFTDRGSRMDLELKGWGLSRAGEFCPKHEFERHLKEAA